MLAYYPLVASSQNANKAQRTHATPMQSSLVGSSEKYRITSFAYLRKRSNLHNHGNIAKLFLFFFLSLQADFSALFRTAAEQLL